VTKACVIGWPLQHTKSPIIHGHWLKNYQIAGSYDARPVHADHLREGIEKLVQEGYAGFNVTVPHKEQILDLLDIVRPEAQAIGAVNTVVINRDGSLEGRNTDAFGFIENLKEEQPDFKFEGSAVILGAGGAARALVHALQGQGIRDVRLVNRTLKRAEDLARSFPGASAHMWDGVPDIIQDASLIVNATSLGMTGQPPLDIELTRAHQNTVVYDIVYTPLQTPLLEQAGAFGLRTVTGIGMLLHQARPAFQAWYGILPEVDSELRAKVLA